MAPHQRTEDHSPIDDLRRDDPGADSLGHMQPEKQKGDEIEERRPGDRDIGREYARRDHRRDRIGGVMQTVEEIEDEGDHDEADKQHERLCHREWAPDRVQACSITMP
jgi:hypothetical protein